MSYFFDQLLRYYFANKEITARDYVQTGLLAMWDGIENAGFGQHSDTLDVWKDLSNNGYDAVKFGNPVVTSNAVDFSGDPDSGYDVMSLLGKPQTFCCEVVFDHKGYRASTFTSPFSSLEAGGWGFQFTNQNANRLDFQVRKTTSYYTPKGVVNNFPKNKISTACINFNRGGKLYEYYNGNLINTVNNVSVCTYNDSFNFLIGNEAGGGDGQKSLNGKVYCVRVYNRALNDEELQHNLKIDKARFNLPIATTLAAMPTMMTNMAEVEETPDTDEEIL